jgi:hypothetical protein
MIWNRLKQSARTAERRTMRGVLISIVVALASAGHPGSAGAREPLPEVAVELVAEGFNAPVFLVAPDDRSGRLFVGEQAGQI